MARASTTSDAFNAVAEPRRREILSYLAGAERPVGEIVAALGLEQPSVSKHLRVLRDVGLVRIASQGRQKDTYRQISQHEDRTVARWKVVPRLGRRQWAFLGQCQGHHAADAA